MHGVIRLDRSAHLRKDDAFLARAKRDPDTQLIVMWRGQSLFEGRPARLATLRLSDASDLVDCAEEVVFLGLDDTHAVLLLDLPGDQEAPSLGERTFLDLFVAGRQLPPDDFRMLSYARGMSLWHRSARFDPNTGAKTQSIESGFARKSESGETLFPRTDPAVMMLLLHEDRCLLARQSRFPPNMFSALAGFVEPGETLEECVIRESKEEVGLKVQNPRYFGSQPWPFPRSLMVGFTAEVLDPSELTLDQDELTESRWVDRAGILKPEGFFVPPPFSLAHHLIHAWAREEI